MKTYSYFLFFLLFIPVAFAQQVYRTPSGTKYHTAKCRYVKNVSNALTVADAKSRGLSPCSICKPSASGGSLGFSSSDKNLGIKPGEAKGTSTSKQCKGKTKSGMRCKRMTKNRNGYCFQHEP